MRTKSTLLILAAVALTSMILIGVASALPISSIASNKPSQTTWVRLNGSITKWGTTDVRGLLDVQAKTGILTSGDTRQFARASAVWTTNLTRTINTVRAKENFSYTFYSAKLLNASVSTFSTSPTNFFLNGTWNVATVNCHVTVVTDSENNIVSVHRESDATNTRVYGELNVTDNWTKFTLKLTGYNTLSGTVSRSVTRQAMFTWYQVTDSVLGTKVSRADVNAVVQAYRSMPGWGNYDNRMDFNFNYKIDIMDLATVGANL